MIVTLNYCAGKEFEKPTHWLNYEETLHVPRIGEHIRLTNPSNQLLLLEVVRVTHNFTVGNSGIVLPSNPPHREGHWLRVRPGIVIPLGEPKDYTDKILREFGFMPT